MKYDGMSIREIVRAINKLDDHEIIDEMFEYPDVYLEYNQYMLEVENNKKRYPNRRIDRYRKANRI